jgi:hypothetical protein
MDRSVKEQATYSIGGKNQGGIIKAEQCWSPTSDPLKR